MKVKYIIAYIVVLSCNTPKQLINTTGSSSNITQNGKLYTAIFQQYAAEYRALCFQAYNIAREKLDADLQKTSLHAPAIITDIDETVLDNSPYAVHQALASKDYDQNAWFNWTKLASADTVPGAPAFLKYAASRNVEVFYISNRDKSERAVTIQNLQKYGLPNADTSHVILKEDSFSKEKRRNSVLNGHDVLLLLGDNLSDFSALFDRKSLDERYKNANSTVNEFGNHFIVLPNPGYGDWESAFFSHQLLTTSQKDSVIRKMLKSF